MKTHNTDIFTFRGVEEGMGILVEKLIKVVAHIAEPRVLLVNPADYAELYTMLEVLTTQDGHSPHVVEIVEKLSIYRTEDILRGYCRIA